MTRVLLDLGLFLAYIGSSVFGLFKMKQAAEIVSASFLIGFAFYGLGFLWWLALLRRMDLSLAFPIAAGGLILATQAVGYFMLQEAMSPLQITGVCLILAGIVVLFLRAV